MRIHRIKKDLNIIFRLIFYSILFFFPASNSIAALLGDTYKPKYRCSTWGCANDRFLYAVVTPSGGKTWNQGSTTDVSFVDDDSLYLYEFEDGPVDGAMWGIFLGAEMRFSPVLMAQIGVSYYQLFSYVTEGHVTQGVDPPTYEVYQYQYNVRSQPLLLEGKLLTTFCFDSFHPFISLGIGGAYNKAYGWSAVVDHPWPFATFTPQFESGTTNSNFVYMAGVGFDLDVTSWMRFGVGYRYFNLGKTQLGQGYINIEPIPQTISQDNIQAQQAIIQLSFII